MGILANFKKLIGDTTTDNDAFYIEMYLTPALNVAAQNSVNYGYTEVVIVKGTADYDLTDPSVAAPAVASAGINELVFDNTYDMPAYLYKQDFYLKSPTTLTFVEPDYIGTSSMFLKYNANYSRPVADPLSDVTDAPSDLQPLIVQYALLLKASADIASNTGGSGISAISGVTRIREDGLELEFNDSQKTEQALLVKMTEVEQKMRDITGFGKSTNYFSWSMV